MIIPIIIGIIIHIVICNRIPHQHNPVNNQEMRTSTYRSASGFFSLGDIDIGAEEASRERDIEVQ